MDAKRIFGKSQVSMVIDKVDEFDYTERKSKRARSKKVMMCLPQTAGVDVGVCVGKCYVSITICCFGGNYN